MLGPVGTGVGPAWWLVPASAVAERRRRRRRRRRRPAAERLRRLAAAVVVALPVVLLLVLGLFGPVMMGFLVAGLAVGFYFVLFCLTCNSWCACVGL